MTLQLSSGVLISEPLLALSQHSTALLNQADSYLVKVLTCYSPIYMAEFFKTVVSVSFLGLPEQTKIEVLAKLHLFKKI